MDELLAPNFVNHAAVPGVTPDREGYKKFATMHHTGFPDFDVKVEDVVAEGDKVARRVTWTGTHKGNYMGIAPTGKQVKVTVITIERIEGGKIAEQWGEADILGLMQQLGVMPSPPEAKGRP
jgi:predicted ester cyclase